ncbi:MAG TPA: MTH938/NDUFAF3 family protein [Anaerolineales bacterium]|nr:MTH938/NDUFAF3 family protein [Anaerolineales bacterium]
MKPKIDSTRFGSITIEGEKYENDVIVQMDGKIKKRKKKLSKAIYGTSHMISLDEAKHIFDEGAEQLIIGTGQEGMVKLSDEAADYFKKKKCQVHLLPTPEAIRFWNKSNGEIIGLFHVTC